MKREAVWFAVVMAMACACATGAAATELARARWLMGTLFTASVPGTAIPDSGGALAALDAALDTVAALESSLSNWRPGSELSRLNAAGSVEHASPPLRAVLDSALAFAVLSGGAFDPTVEPLTLAWDLRGQGRVPEPGRLAAARERVGWRHAVLDPRADRIRLTHGAQLDLGGIAKGFALDRAADVLRARGVTEATLDAGGQRLSLGDHTLEVWIAHPERRDVPAVLVRVPGGSISTSAQSERSLRVRSGRSGHTVGHILDPRTGSPVRTRASVSVLAASGTRADALSTALLVLGPDAARTFALAHPELGVLWLEPSGREVRAYAWNLHVLNTMPGITLTRYDLNPSLARTP